MAASHWEAHAGDEELIDPLEMRPEPFIDEALNSVDIESIDSRSGERPVADSEGGTEERHRRRRRRRGRGRGRRLDSEAPSANEPTPPSAEDLAEPIIGADAATEVESGPMEPLDTAEAERPFRLEGQTERPGEARGEEEHRRRRRRRRGRRGRTEERPASAEGTERPRSERTPREPERPSERPSERQPERQTERQLDRQPDRPPDRVPERATGRLPERPDAELAEDDDDSLYALVHEEELDEEGRTDDLHLSHKKIPSWEEAVESVIAANMASRASNPSSGSRGRGRGHRDR